MSKQRNKAVSLPVIKPNAAGIDIGATEIFVAVPADRDPEPIRSFPTFTIDLERLADWLQQCQIRTVAMESTGVYWIPSKVAEGEEPPQGSKRRTRKTPWRNEPAQLREDLLSCIWRRLDRNPWRQLPDHANAAHRNRSESRSISDGRRLLLMVEAMPGPKD